MALNQALIYSRHKKFKPARIRTETPSKVTLSKKNGFKNLKLCFSAEPSDLSTWRQKVELFPKFFLLQRRFNCTSRDPFQILHQSSKEPLHKKCVFAEHKSKNLIYLLSLKCYAKVNHSYFHVSRTLCVRTCACVSVYRCACVCECVCECERVCAWARDWNFRWVGGRLH